MKYLYLYGTQKVSSLSILQDYCTKRDLPSVKRIRRKHVDLKRRKKQPIQRTLAIKNPQLKTIHLNGTVLKSVQFEGKVSEVRHCS